MEVCLEDEENLGENLLFGEGDTNVCDYNTFINYYFYLSTS